VDDILDYESADSTMGKPGGADLQLGLATGPALFAWEEHPELGPLIERKFKEPGDVELVCRLFVSFHARLAADTCESSRPGITFDVPLA
jgi:geranylgeranyl pyrophosphate synthase